MKSPLEAALGAYLEETYEDHVDAFGNLAVQEEIETRMRWILPVLRETANEGETPSRDRLERAKIEADRRGLASQLSDVDLADAMRLGGQWMLQELEAKSGASNFRPDPGALEEILRRFDPPA